MMTELTTKESIRLGQAMNIVGQTFANAVNVTDFNVEMTQRQYRSEVLALYKVLTDIEAEIVAKKNEKKPMSFPTGSAK